MIPLKNFFRPGVHFTEQFRKIFPIHLCRKNPPELLSETTLGAIKPHFKAQAVYC